MSNLDYQKCSLPQLATIILRLRLARAALWLGMPALSEWIVSDADLAKRKAKQ